MTNRDPVLSVAQALARAHREAASAPADASKTDRPQIPNVITISREPGALGSRVAQEVGRILGWQVYDQELLVRIAEEMKRTPEQLRGLDERDVSWLEESLTALLSKAYVSPTAYLMSLVAVVRAFGRTGQCVIVGRGAGWILPRETTLRVRLIAPQPFRVRVIAEQRHLTEAEAAQWIERSGHDRVQFLRQHFKADPTDPHQYHLMMNVADLPATDYARVIVDLLHLLQRRPASASDSPAAPTLGTVPIY